MFKYSFWVFAISILSIVVNALTIKSPSITIYTTNTIIGLCCFNFFMPVAFAIRQLHSNAIGQIKFKLLRSLVATRKYYSITDINNYILHMGAAGMLIVGFFYLVGYESVKVFLPYIAIVISLSFVLDLKKRMKFIAKKIWSGILGKIFMALIAAFSYTLSTALARSWIFNTTHIDPQSFSEYINTISILFVPLAYLLLICALSLVIVLPEMIFFIAIGVFSYIKGAFSRNWLSKLDSLSIRLKTGKRPEQLNEKEKALINSRLIFFRGLSSVVFVLSLVFLSSEFYNLIKSSFDSALRSGLVSYYYHQKDNPIEDDAYYYSINEKIDSRAVLTNGGWLFSKSAPIENGKKN